MTRLALTSTLVPALAAAATLSGCATSGAPQPSYSEEVATLAADCEKRGGILVPSGRQDGRAATDNVCRISGGGSRLTD